MILLSIWLGSCILVGILGTKVNFNFWQGFAVSIMLTPAFGLMSVLLCGERG